jgi:hypothetical protein
MSHTKRDRLQDFRNAYDETITVPKAIDAGLKALGDDYEPELTFIKRCGVSPVKFAAFRDRYTDFWLEVREAGKASKRIWCGTKDFAAKCRKAANGQA